jgi:hypothetical protein
VEARLHGVATGDEIVDDAEVGEPVSTESARARHPATTANRRSHDFDITVVPMPPVMIFLSEIVRNAGFGIRRILGCA